MFLPLFHPNLNIIITLILPQPIFNPNLDFNLILFLDDGRYATRYCLAAWYDDRARPDKWNNVESHAECDDAPG